MARGVGVGAALLLGLLLVGGQGRMRTPVLPPGRGRGSVPPPPPPPGGGLPYLATPTEYAQGKLATMRARASGELGALCERWVPEAFGPCPWELAIGASAMATGQTELVPGPLREIGFFNTPTGTWRTLRTDPLVRALLGRDAIDPEGDAWERAVADQTAIGLADLLRGQRAFADALPALAPATPGSAWGWYVALSSWSAGAGGTASHLRPYAQRLASVPGSQRVGAYVSALLADVLAGAFADAADRAHSNAAYSALRTLQKLECARQLARSLAPSAAELDGWWDQLPTLSEGEEAILVRGARGRAAA